MMKMKGLVDEIKVKINIDATQFIEELKKYLSGVEASNGTGFNDALVALKRGKKVTRKGWHKPGMFVQLQIPDLNSKMTACYLYITIEENYRMPWHPSQADMIEEDWVIMD